MSRGGVLAAPAKVKPPPPPPPLDVVFLSAPRPVDSGVPPALRADNKRSSLRRLSSFSSSIVIAGEVEPPGVPTARSAPAPAAASSVDRPPPMTGVGGVPSTTSAAAAADVRASFTRGEKSPRPVPPPPPPPPPAPAAPVKGVVDSAAEAGRGARMGVGVVASAAAAVPAIVAASTACCHLIAVTPPPTCAAVVYITAPPPPPPPPSLPALREGESMRGSIHTTRPSPDPAASAPPSPRHVNVLADAPNATEPTNAARLPLVVGAFVSSNVTRPSLLAAAMSPGVVGEKDACQQRPPPPPSAASTLAARRRIPVSHRRTKPSALELANNCRR